jgi:hypothetical protein
MGCCSVCVQLPRRDTIFLPAAGTFETLNRHVFLIGHCECLGHVLLQLNCRRLGSIERGEVEKVQSACVALIQCAANLVLQGGEG